MSKLPHLSQFAQLPVMPTNNVGLGLGFGPCALRLMPPPMPPPTSANRNRFHAAKHAESDVSGRAARSSNPQATTTHRRAMSSRSVIFPHAFFPPPDFSTGIHPCLASTASCTPFSSSRPPRPRCPACPGEANATTDVPLTLFPPVLPYTLGYLLRFCSRGHRGCMC